MPKHNTKLSSLIKNMILTIKLHMRNKPKPILFFILCLIGILASSHRMAIAAENPVPPLSTEELHTYIEVSQRIKSDYIHSVDDKKLFNACIKGMVSGIDAESAYLDAETLGSLIRQTANVGLEVSIVKDQPIVIAPIEDGPAYDAGVKSEDVIVKIDEALTKGMPLDEVVKRLRGNPDTKIRLTLKRKGENQPIILTLTRANFKAKDVKFKLIEPDFAYVRITQFNEGTGSNLAKAIVSLIEQNQRKLSGFILDLRNNPGGLLTSAVAVSAVFLHEDSLVLFTEARTADAKMRLTASQDYLRWSDKQGYIKKLPPLTKLVPMVVLVNNGSAAASEIVAGALQDHKRAIIMGTSTFGKASMQTILPLENRAAIKLTTSRWFTPNGRSVQLDGIVPDVVIEGTSDMPAQVALHGDTQLAQALSFLKTHPSPVQ